MAKTYGNMNDVAKSIIDTINQLQAISKEILDATEAAKRHSCQIGAKISSDDLARLSSSMLDVSRLLDVLLITRSFTDRFEANKRAQAEKSEK